MFEFGSTARLLVTLSLTGMLSLRTPAARCHGNIQSLKGRLKMFVLSVIFWLKDIGHKKWNNIEQYTTSLLTDPFLVLETLKAYSSMFGGVIGCKESDCLVDLFYLLATVAGRL